MLSELAGPDVDVASAIRQHPDGESLLKLLRSQKDRLTLAHVAIIWDKLAAAQESRRVSNIHDIQALELSCHAALLRQSDFDSAFCRHGVLCMKKFKSSELSKCTSLLEALCDHLLASLETSQAPDVSCMFDGLALMHTERSRSFWESLSARAICVLKDFDLLNLADILAAVAMLKVNGWCAELIEAACLEVAQLIEHSDKTLIREPKVVANVMWAFATMEQPLPDQLLRLFIAKFQQIPHESWRAHHVATICYSLAKLNLSSHAKSCLDFLSQQTCLDLWKSYSAKHISDTFWAYAAVKKTPDAGLVKVLSQRAIEVMRDFSPEALSNLLHALASLKKDCQWSSRLLVKMCEHGKSLSLDDVGHQHVSATMWALVTLYQDDDGQPSKLAPEALDLMMRLLQRLPKLARDATPQFLVHTMQAMASVHRFSQGHQEDDTTYIRRASNEEGARDALERINEQKAEVWKHYCSRFREVADALDAPLMTAMLWSMRMLAVHAESDVLTILTRHALTMNDRDLNVVDIMWTHGVLWSKPDASLLVQLHSRIMMGADKLSLMHVTRLLWGLAAMYAQQGQGEVDWRSVLDKLAILLLKHQHELDAIHIKQLHQFFLTCNTSRALVDVLPDSIFEVKEKLEDRCCRDVREASAAQRLEHSLGDGCAAQLRKLGLECRTEEECPNTGYNLDLRIFPTQYTPPHLLPPEIMGHRGWVLEIDRPCHYLAASSRALKEGRCRLREAHLQGVGYSVTFIPHWEWEQILRRPDDQVLAYLSDKLQALFAKALAHDQNKFAEGEGGILSG